MRRIYKFTFEGIGIQRVSMQPGKIIHVGLDPQGNVCFWAEVDPEGDMRNKGFLIMPTGAEVPDFADLKYLASVVQGPYVWHVYEGV